MRRGPKARRRLKRCITGIEHALDTHSPAAEADTARLQILSHELELWPRLNAKNLHPFRIHVKELRYMLQLLPDMRKAHLDALDDVKDAVGEWHDWLELQQIAQAVLDPLLDRAVLTAIKSTVKVKLRSALAAANRLRERGIERMLTPWTRQDGSASRSRHPARRRRASH